MMGFVLVPVLLEGVDLGCMVLVMVVVVVMVVALAYVSARLAYFSSLDASFSLSEPHLRTIALSDMGVRQNDVFLGLGG